MGLHHLVHEVSHGFRCLVLHLAGGMTIEGLDSGRDTSDPQIKGSWDLPVDLSKVESIQFGDVVVPLKQAKK